MRACATGSAIFVGLLLGAMSFVACSSGSAPPQPPPEPDSVPPPAASGAADMPSETPDPGSAAPKKTAQSMEDCKAITGSTSAMNDPPKGTVMNNAMTSGDAGTSDRMEALINLVKTRRDGFRCCYDLYTKSHPNDGGRILMVWNIKGDGSIDKIEVDQAKSTLHAPEAEACMQGLAQGLPYPPSPAKKTTTFSYPFEFRNKK